MRPRCSTCSRRITLKTAALYRGRCALCHLKKPPARFNGPGQLLLPIPRPKPVATIDTETPPALPGGPGSSGRLF